jgi:hypothetical protein
MPMNYQSDADRVAGVKHQVASFGGTSAMSPLTAGIRGDNQSLNTRITSPFGGASFRIPRISRCNRNRRHTLVLSPFLNGDKNSRLRTLNRACKRNRHEMHTK